MKKTLVQIKIPNKNTMYDLKESISKAQNRLGLFQDYEFIITSDNIEMNVLSHPEDQFKLFMKIFNAPVLKYCESNCKRETLQTLISTSTLFKDGKMSDESDWEYECSGCHQRNHFKVKIE